MELLTVAEIARRLNLPESTVRYYRDRFEKYIPDVGTGRSRRYQEEALEVFRFIADNMRSNVPVEEVEYALQSRFAVAIEPQQQSAATQQQSAAVMRELIADALRYELRTIHDEIAATREENRELRELIEERLNERDRILVETLRELQTAKQQKRRWPWSKK